MSKAPVPSVYTHLPQWALGHSKEAAEELCALVLDGKKTATCSALYHYENEPVPEPGDRSVLLDGAGRPRCVIECVAAEIVPFDEVDAKFARDEGEGDGSLVNWRKIRESHLKREGYFAADMLLVCEHFRVIERLDFRRVAP
ncbi:MAG: ASCH domain-containing protein [Rhodospirillaceae bacterium]|nr:ASCH domain-containing protein [Rhodospirillaceae bacterium]